MKHFSDQVWADFVRSIGSETSNSEIKAHIASACPDCAPAFGMWRKVHSIAVNEPSLTPPDQSVRMIKLEFSTRQSPKSDPWTIARLAFDSLSQPVVAGMRSGGSDSRQLVFDADGTMVDLVIDVQPQAGTLSLVGQVVDKGGAKIAPRQAAVVLWAETGQPLAETASNEFGEFQMEFAAQARLRLSVEIAGKKPIRIPQINLAPDVTRPVT